MLLPIVISEAAHPAAGNICRSDTFAVISFAAIDFYIND